MELHLFCIMPSIYYFLWNVLHINGLMQTWYNSIANVIELNLFCIDLDSKVRGANIGPTWVLSAPGGPMLGHKPCYQGSHRYNLFLWKWFFHCNIFQDKSPRVAIVLLRMVSVGGVTPPLIVTMAGCFIAVQHILKDLVLMRTIHYRQNKVNLDEFFCYWNNADEFSLSYVRDEDKSILSCVFPDSKVYGANMGPTWGPSGADRTQVGPMLASWTLLSGLSYSELF